MQSAESISNIEVIDEQVRRKIITDFILANHGCTAEDIVRGQNKIGRVKVFRLLKNLKKENVVIAKQSRLNKRDKKLFVNNANPQVFVPLQLERFEKDFKHLLETTKKMTEEKYESAISRISNTQTKDNSYMKALAQINYEFASLNSQPLYLLYAVVDAYLLHSTALWPKLIKDKETLKNLYIYVFKKIADMQIYLFESFKSTRIGSHGNMSDVIIPHTQFRLQLTYRMRRCINIYTKFNMKKEIEQMIDALWKIEGRLQQHICPEPLLYGWNFNYNEGWRKLLKLQEEYPEQTFGNYVCNTIENSGYGEIDEVKNSKYMKREREKKFKNE